jgi:hypothetical protein
MYSKGLKYLFKVLFNMHFLAGTVKMFENGEGHCSAVTAFNAVALFAETVVHYHQNGYHFLW